MILRIGRRARCKIIRGARPDHPKPKAQFDEYWNVAGVTGMCTQRADGQSISPVTYFIGRHMSVGIPLIGWYLRPIWDNCGLAKLVFEAQCTLSHADLFARLIAEDRYIIAPAKNDLKECDKQGCNTVPGKYTRITLTPHSCMADQRYIRAHTCGGE